MVWPFGRRRAKAPGTASGSGADDRSFDEIMVSITSGLTGQWPHDGEYLREQMEAYKCHPLAKEIVRACARLLYESTPSDLRDEIERAVESHQDATQTTLEEVARNLRAGNLSKAMELMEPLAEKMDALVESGWDADDSESRYFDFRSVNDEVVWRAHNRESRTIRRVTEPFSQVYITWGSCLLEARRHREAIEACGKAIRWNPADVSLRFELGENYKHLRDMVSYERVLAELYPYVATAGDLARYHRAMGFLCIEQGRFELAAAHLKVSMLFGKSDMPMGELMYMKTKHGQDYTDMTVDAAVAVLQAAGEQILIDEDTYQALRQLVIASIDAKEYQTTLRTATDLLLITGDEKYGELIRALRGGGS